jgi:uncharacterized protein YigA (DUF484 family)
LSQTRDQARALTALTVRDVRAFVLSNAEQFQGDAEILAALLSHADNGGNVVDLQRFIIARLRQELSLVRTQGQAFIEAAAANLLAQERIHSAVLRLLEARSFRELIRIVSQDLAALVGADIAVLCVEGAADEELPRNPPSGIAMLAPGLVEATLGEGVRHLLNAGRKRLPTVYGRLARKVRSEAFIRLSFGRKAPPGLLVLGSYDAETFAPEQRMELLEFLARTLERAMRAWLTRESK